VACRADRIETTKAVLGLLRPVDDPAFRRSGTSEHKVGRLFIPLKWLIVIRLACEWYGECASDSSYKSHRSAHQDSSCMTDSLRSATWSIESRKKGAAPPVINPVAALTQSAKSTKRLLNVFTAILLIWEVFVYDKQMISDPTACVHFQREHGYGGVAWLRAVRLVLCCTERAIAPRPAVLMMRSSVSTAKAAMSPRNCCFVIWGMAFETLSGAASCAKSPAPHSSERAFHRWWLTKDFDRPFLYTRLAY